MAPNLSAVVPDWLPQSSIQNRFARSQSVSGGNSIAKPLIRQNNLFRAKRRKAHVRITCKKSSHADPMNQRLALGTPAYPIDVLIRKKIEADKIAAAGTVMIQAAMIVMKCERRTSLRRRRSSGA